MTAKEARRLIGKSVTWEECHDRHRGTFLPHKDVIEEVAGRNVRMRVCDWLWLPDLMNLQETQA